MTLRQWQKKAIAEAQHSFSVGRKSFLVMASPGAGKTIMASELARYLLNRDLIDIVICVTPSITVKNSFQKTLEQCTGYRMDGLLGSRGAVITYQALAPAESAFLSRLGDHRVMVIYDEIHHCSGSSTISGNSWGQAITHQLESRARFSLALSGTPWRSDNLPVSALPYCREEGDLKPDFVYGLAEAIEDNVCRCPKLIIIDNNGIQITEHAKSDAVHFNTIEAFVEQSPLPYQKLLENDELLFNVLEKASIRLRHLRHTQPLAAGLVVASTIAHAKRIVEILNRRLGEQCLLVNSQVKHANKLIEQFRDDDTPWLVSVGMVSEGTDIPRLQICCHLSRIKTELHFRQVLGRILRYTGGLDHDCYMYLLADPQLVTYAQRLDQDLPSSYTVFDSGQDLSVRTTQAAHYSPDSFEDQYSTNPDDHMISVAQELSEEASQVSHLDEARTQSNNNAYTLSVFGDFWERLIVLNSR